MKTGNLELKNRIACYSKRGKKWEVVIGLYSTTTHSTFSTAKEAEAFVCEYNRKIQVK
jgi:hypothetical protein